MFWTDRMELKFKIQAHLLLASDTSTLGMAFKYLHLLRLAYTQIREFELTIRDVNLNRNIQYPILY